MFLAVFIPSLLSESKFISRLLTIVRLPLDNLEISFFLDKFQVPRFLQTFLNVYARLHVQNETDSLFLLHLVSNKLFSYQFYLTVISLSPVHLHE
jgi:hypothetical protein